MRLALLAFVLATLAGFTPGQSADAATKVRLGVLKFGTVSWVLDTIQRNGLDKAEGIELDMMPLASTDATAVGLQGGSADIIATDWLWVSRERTGGADFTFSPFTTALGAIMVPADSPIKTLADLKGKKLGVAGGPIDKSWLLIVAYALRTANLDLRTETRQVFGAPPLLAEKAKQGEIDAVLNFWPYAARLEAAGFNQLIGIEDVVSELGAKGEVAMVGYVFSEAWAKENLKAVDGFLRAAAKADELLATSNEAWEPSEPLMRAENDRPRPSRRCGGATARASPSARRPRTSPTPRSSISSCASLAARSWSVPAPSLLPARSGRAANLERQRGPSRNSCRARGLTADRSSPCSRSPASCSCGSSPPRSRRAECCRGPWRC